MQSRAEDEMQTETKASNSQSHYTMDDIALGKAVKLLVDMQRPVVL